MQIFIFIFFRINPLPCIILGFWRCYCHLTGLGELRGGKELVRDRLSDVTVYRQLKLIHFQKVTRCRSASAAGAKPLAQPYITLRTRGFGDLAGEEGQQENI